MYTKILEMQTTESNHATLFSILKFNLKVFPCIQAPVHIAIAICAILYSISVVCKSFSAYTHWITKALSNWSEMQNSSLI